MLLGAVVSSSPRTRYVLHATFAALGLGVVSWLVVDAGPRRLASALTRLAAWFPVVWLLEGARLGANVWASRLLYGRAGARLGLGKLIHASLMAYTAILLLPAGRLGGEAIKAAMLRREVGLPRAAAAAVYMQAFPLLAGFVVSIPCLIAAAWVWGASALTVAVGVQALTAIALGAAIVVAIQRPGLGRIVERVSARLGAGAGRVRDEVVEMGWLPPRPFAAALLGRALLGSQLIVLASAVEVPRGFLGGLLTFGLHLVGQALGDLVPAQLGTTDGALAVAAEPLGADAASLVAASLLFHASQLTWAAIGATAALVRR